MTHRRLRLSVLLLAVAVGTPTMGATDPSFLFSATANNFRTYFPSYLANGYFSTLTSPRGTGPKMGYMVAFMDYRKGDISRPAAVPGWSEIDYNPGPGWLNSTPLNKTIFRHYTQTLNMHDGTLATHYHFVYAGKSTDVRVTTFVSQASHHLAATQLSITPQFSGTVRLRFPVRLWSEHQPRFPLGHMTGPQMINAVIASGQNLHNKPVPTADRAPVWYPGHTRIIDDHGDTKALTLSLNGRAVNGLTMAEAVAVGLPRQLKGAPVKLHKGHDLLSLDLTMRVHKGTTYTFTKYIALSRHGWGGDAQDDAALAKAARSKGFDALLKAHRAAWHRLWRSDIVVDGDPAVQRALHSDLYYLLSNTTTDTAWPVGACGLTPNYSGHAFWDSDSWVFPALLLLHPERAKSLVTFRHRTMAPARKRAKRYGAKGTMYPWEADPQTGVDVTPHYAYGVYREIHVNADVAIAQWQYYLATGDTAWLKHDGWPVIRGVARFWTSRVTYDKAKDRYEIHHVTSPDEAYSNVLNDTFTNAAARKSLRIAIKAAQVVGAKADPRWADIAAKMYIPFSHKQQRHDDFDPSVPHDKVTWMGSSLIWLMNPSLDLKMSQQVRRNDFDFQLEQLQKLTVDPNEMMTSMLSVGAADLGKAASVGKWLHANLHGFLKPPFNVRSETAANNAGYILSTSAGFVQSVMYGLTGLRIENGGVVDAHAPVLPSDWHALTLKNVSIKGRRYDITVRRNAQGKAQLQRTPVSGNADATAKTMH